MTLLRWLIRPYLYARYYIERWTRTGAFGADPAVYLKENYTPTGNALKDGLHRFHVKQFHESSCSVASVTSAVNTLIDQQQDISDLSSGWKAVTQQDLLDKVKAAHWKERMSDNGYKGRRGLPLIVLGEVMKASMDVYQIQYKQIEIIQTTRHPNKIEACRMRLRKHLLQFEQQGDCMLIAHFDQGSFLPEMHIPHISPVGGFDPDTSMVKMLDVDYTQIVPYQISFNRFYNGLSTNYNAVFRHYGFAEGGYVFIQL